MLVVKFLLASQLLESCLETLHAGFAAASAQTGEDGVDADMRSMVQLQEAVSEGLSELTETMATELTLTTLYGVLVLLELVLLLVDTVQRGARPASIVSLLLYMSGAVVTLVVPCEQSERLLRALGGARDLLLRLERRSWPRATQAGLLRRLVARDLATAGDLGLFRLRRATLLTICTTIVTYIIVGAQFRLSGTGAGSNSDTLDVENVTVTQ
ncbi:hypothetical protein FJT64_012029 [Amphibalanus amphitrite]|uniref:Uncharacterized protein n=1 Tax=Amphibalanus amphitrite TaxID=1232801 RepID=A0A6A4V7X6_AMPAM|nr:hypothetical protein FJT64_012029 [Amphibalanus amphitrite]